MGRFSKSKSYGHSAVEFGAGVFQIGWTVDRYYKNSRLRHPIGFRVSTDKEGAERFAKRWGIKIKLIRERFTDGEPGQNN